MLTCTKRLRKETKRNSKKQQETKRRIKNADLYEILLSHEIIEMLSKQKSNSNLYDSKCSSNGNVFIVPFCYHSDEIKVR